MKAEKYGVLEADRFLEGLITSGLTPGISVCCRQGGQVTYRFHQGSEMPKGQGNPVLPGTRFNLASVSKVFTALLVLKLIETGTLALNDPVARHIPEYPFLDVQLRHLLTHTAGYDETRLINRPETGEEVPRYLNDLYALTKRKYKVGEQQAYWTYAYSMVMDVVQRAAGENFEDLVKKYLLEPLGMQSTTFHHQYIPQGESVFPWNEGAQQLHKEFSNDVITGDAGIWSTAEDLAVLGSMIVSGGAHNGRRVMSASAIALMLREQAGRGFKNPAGLWIRGEEDTFGCFGDLASPQAAGHTGMTGCMLLVEPKLHLSAAILTNSIKLHEDWGNYQRVCNTLVAMHAM